MTSLEENAPGRWIAVLRGSHERLRALAEPLNTQQLGERSYASEWPIAQVLSHLGSGAEIFTLFLDAAITGTEPPGRDRFVAIWDGWNAKSPADQARDALVSDGRLVERLESLDAGQLAGLRVPLLGADRDVVGVVRMRLNEHAVHTWDVAVALDPTATVAPDAVELLIDGLDQTVAFAGKPTGLYARVQVHTTNPARDLVLTVGDSVAVAPWDGGDDPTGELTLPAEALLRLVTGRLDPNHTPAELATTGVDLDDLRKVFPGY
jgi:uncharacterized protein (TIGR03083 family)